jgi:hypothetical protein
MNLLLLLKALASMKTPTDAGGGSVMSCPACDAGIPTKTVTYKTAYVVTFGKDRVLFQDRESANKAIADFHQRAKEEDLRSYIVPHIEQVVLKVSEKQ